MKIAEAAGREAHEGASDGDGMKNCLYSQVN